MSSQQSVQAARTSTKPHAMIAPKPIKTDFNSNSSKKLTKSTSQQHQHQHHQQSSSSQSSQQQSQQAQQSQQHSNSMLQPPASPQLRTSHSTTRRVWVKRANGTPTTLVINQDYIVDDLKQDIMYKFPNSLAKVYDPADLRLSIVKSDKKKSNENKINLEPDQSVWFLLDQHFPNGMSMNDSFLIEVPTQQDSENAGGSRGSFSSPYHSGSQVQLSQLYHNSMSQQHQTPKTLPKSTTPTYFQPKPQHSHQSHKSLANLPKERSISPANTLHPGVLHRRSQSNPPNSPSSDSNSQAVLLLPKNFSLNTGSTAPANGSVSRNSNKKRLSLDETSVANSESAISSPGHITELSRKPETIDEDTAKEIIKVKEKNGNDDRNYGTSPSLAGESKRKVSDSKREEEAKHNKPNRSLKGPTDRVLPSISVLVVEDNAINQAILGAFLRRHKIHYQIAKNGQEAIDKWRKGGFHLVLMDIQLPVKSGIEATKEIRHLEKINKIGVFAESDGYNTNLTSEEIRDNEILDMNLFRSPVIIVALTASSNSSVDRKNALMAGCNDYLTKPVNLVWLQNKITEWGCMQALIDFDGWKSKKILKSRDRDSQDNIHKVNKSNEMLSIGSS